MSRDEQCRALTFSTMPISPERGEPTSRQIDASI
jgi:hypothetical protein